MLSVYVQALEKHTSVVLRQRDQAPYQVPSCQ